MGVNIEGDTRQERCLSQLKHWVNGKSIHNFVDGECCPDFSCCRPKMLMHIEDRKRFMKAYINGDRKTEMAILGMALSGLASETGKTVRISWEKPIEH